MTIKQAQEPKSHNNADRKYERMHQECDWWGDANPAGLAGKTPLNAKISAGRIVIVK